MGTWPWTLQKYFYAPKINSYDFKMLTVIDFLSDMNNWLPSLLLLVYFVCFKNLCFLYSLLAPATSGQVATLKRGALTASLSWGTTDRQSGTRHREVDTGGGGAPQVWPGPLGLLLLSKIEGQERLRPD